MRSPITGWEAAQIFKDDIGPTGDLARAYLDCSRLLEDEVALTSALTAKLETAEQENKTLKSALEITQMNLRSVTAWEAKKPKET